MYPQASKVLVGAVVCILFISAGALYRFMFVLHLASVFARMVDGGGRWEEEGGGRRRRRAESQHEDVAKIPRKRRRRDGGGGNRAERDSENGKQ